MTWTEFTAAALGLAQVLLPLLALAGMLAIFKLIDWLSS